MTRNFNKILNETGSVTVEQIHDFERYRRERRETLTLFQHPMATIKVFIGGLLSITIYTIQNFASNPWFLYAALPSIIIFVLLQNMPGPQSELVQTIVFSVEFVVWWVGLGVLSSVGLGSGLQSGVLFLFPHIIRTCLAAETCNNLDFDSYSNMWFRSPATLFKCSTDLVSPTPVTFFGIWQKVILVCFLQSAGTALGEIPPYWMTKAARIAAIEAAGNTNELPEELESNSDCNFINRSKMWMIGFLKTNGFYGVLFMASWPNLAFDLCGICCGHFLMPFREFFLATFIGKAVIRNTYQSIIYIMLCSPDHLESFIQVLQYCVPDSFQLDQTIREVLEEGRESFQKIKDPVELEKDSKSSLGTDLGNKFYMYWQFLVTVLLFSFFLSCIADVAQYYQLSIDQEDANKLRKRLPQQTENESIKLKNEKCVGAEKRRQK